MVADRLTTLAMCWRIERRDGMSIALTDHDRDIVRGDTRYRAAPGMTPSAIVRGDALDADTMEAKGALGTAALSERDLLAGRWDGARVTAVAVDWSDAAVPAVPLGAGWIGEVGLRDGSFTAELRGVAAAFDAPVTEATSPECRATLGDRRCRVPMRGRRRHARVVAAAGETVTLDVADPVANGWASGRLRWLTGENAGLTSAVVESAGAVVTLRTAPPFAVAPGVLVRIVEGCDGRIATCAGRFGNAANFRGEPYLPGIDLLTRYPGA